MQLPETNKPMKKRGWWWKLPLIGVVLALGLIFGIPTLKRWWLFHEMPWLEVNTSLSNKPVHVNWSGIDYWIPENYLDTPLQYINEKDGANFRLLLPDMIPKTKDNYHVFTHDLDKVMGLLVSPRQNMPTFDYMVKGRMTDEFQGISRHLAKSGELYGLEHFTIIEPNPDDYYQYEILVRREGNTVIEFLECTPESALPALKKVFPLGSLGCEYHFWYDGLWIKASFRRSHLPEWQEIHNKIVAMFKSFRSLSILKSKGD
jgi:hypothetical protein